MLACGARTSPAMQRNSVVLPQPDAPNRAVIPVLAICMRTCSSKASRANRSSSDRLIVSISYRDPIAAHATIGGVDDQQQREAGEKQCQRQMLRRPVVQYLHMIEDRDRRGLGAAGDIAADHQHHTKF